MSKFRGPPIYTLIVDYQPIVSRLVMRFYDAKTNNTMNQQTVTETLYHIIVNTLARVIREVQV
jgi:hypothetical protein